MNCRVLILRPIPGAEETAARARALALEPIVAPLFRVRPIPWSAPDPRPFDAVMLTSANAARHGGDGMTPFLSLPCWAVGEATAEAAEAGGFSDVRTGPSDGAALLQAVAAAGIRTLFHPGAVDHLPLDHPDLQILRTAVYASEASPNVLPTLLAAFDADPLVLLHSPRAASTFASIIGRPRSSTRLAAISAATAEAAGDGWRSIHVAAAPRDAALLELAAKLCQTRRD